MKRGVPPPKPSPSLAWLLKKWGEGDGLEPTGLLEVNGIAISRIILHQIGERDVIALTMTSEVLQRHLSIAVNGSGSRIRKRRGGALHSSTVYLRVNEGVT